MQNNRLESGRSMVEMLGTLVVIGILSIGSIMGYSYAIDKYKANETLNELQIRVLDWSQQVINGATELSNTEMGDKTSLGYPIEAQISPLYEDYFEVFLDEVPSSVCHHLVQSGWTLPFSIFIGLEEYETNPEICDKNDKVTLAYEFKNDLTPKEAIPEEDRHKTFRCKNDNDCKCGTCTEGLCVSICPQGASCAIDFDNASSYVCCLKEFTVGNLCCNSVDANGHCCKSNGVCCPENAPILGADGKCYSCDTQKGINVYGMTENCNVCSNRVVSQQGYCGLKCGIKGTITEDKPLKGTDGGCYACDEPKTISSDNCSVCPNRFTGTTYDSPNQNCYACGIPGTTVENKPLGGLHGTCYSCDEANPVLLGVNSAGHKCEDVCPNRTSDGDRAEYGNHYCSKGVCTADKPIMTSGGVCADCAYGKAVFLESVFGGCETACPNRKVVDNLCVLETCPEDKPLKGTDGGCYACDEPKTISSDNCSVCPNRFTGTTYDSPNQNCYACGTPGTTVENKPIAGWWGTCYSCDESESVFLGVNSAGHKCEDVCPNRTSDGDRSGYGNHYCSKGVCTADKPIMTSGGVCADCAYGKAVFLESVFGGCETACPNRKVVDNLCVLETCPEDKPLKGTDGGCYACDEPKTISSDNCSVCPNRFTGTTYDSPNQNCYACGTPGTTVENKPIAGLWGTCYSCEELETITTGVSTEEFRCETVCPNREADGYSYGNPICKRTSCPEDKQLEDKNGACHACNTSVGIDVNGDNTKCEKCLNRKLDGDYCVLSE